MRSMQSQLWVLHKHPNFCVGGGGGQKRNLKCIYRFSSYRPVNAVPVVYKKSQLMLRRETSLFYRRCL
jgi:hypothetical protein